MNRLLLSLTLLAVAGQAWSMPLRRVRPMRPSELAAALNYRVPEVSRATMPTRRDAERNRYDGVSPSTDATALTFARSLGTQAGADVSIGGYVFGQTRAMAAARAAIGATWRAIQKKCAAVEELAKPSPGAFALVDQEVARLRHTDPAEANRLQGLRDDMSGHRSEQEKRSAVLKALGVGANAKAEEPFDDQLAAGHRLVARLHLGEAAPEAVARYLGVPPAHVDVDPVGEDRDHAVERASKDLASANELLREQWAKAVQEARAAFPVARKELALQEGAGPSPANIAAVKTVFAALRPGSSEAGALEQYLRRVGDAMEWQDREAARLKGLGIHLEAPGDPTPFETVVQQSRAELSVSD